MPARASSTNSELVMINSIFLCVPTNESDTATHVFHDFRDLKLWATTMPDTEYLSKGRSVLIEGRLQLDQWDDRETGQKRSKLKVIGENMTMLGSGNGGNGGGQQQQGYQQPQQNQQYQQPAGNDGWDQPSGVQGRQPDLDNVPF